MECWKSWYGLWVAHPQGIAKALMDWTLLRQQDRYIDRTKGHYPNEKKKKKTSKKCLCDLLYQKPINKLRPQVLVGQKHLS